ncbi:TonB-dependent receptor [Fulvivirgaceae bacterium PWU4]|uniref:TonB-dependent receptor n=1 Tax=Chryseosolibacter histidini TaxID=2782349 RepID=A0AAP2DKY9_9BACT|nr:TonB-dependent receptor [Chryseosolibacter histidini]MBT1696882.1 TonB-dependent receptor [Chryseosolibacter histidini]
MVKFYPLIKTPLCLLLLLACFQVQAQEVTVKGSVVSMDDGAPIPGVSISLKGTSSGTFSDEEGKYVIQAPADGILVFSFIGYNTQEIPINNRTQVDIRMSTDVQTLQEVVVVGYGTQTKREITGSIAKVSGDKIAALPTTSFEAALQGQAAGVQVIQGSGLSGSGSVIRIRGIASVSANGDPLYVVDGIPITADNFLQEANWQNGAFNNNPLSAINPSDIESIEILKDAAAAGIYGSRGSNGVVLITTKRGKGLTGKPVFDFSMNIGTSSPVAKPKFYNSQQWLQARQEAWENDGNTGAVWLPGYSDADDSPEARLAAFQKASQVNTDWWDLVTQTGLKQQYNLSTTFNRKKLSAYIGGSYANNESYIAGNSLQRYSIRANIDYKLSNKLDLGLSTSYSQVLNHRVRVAYTGGLGLAMSTALPIYPVFDDNGDYFRTSTSGNGNNPLFERDNFQGYTVDYRTINSLLLRYAPLSNLKFTIGGSYDYLDQKNDTWQSALLQGTNYNQAERDLRYVDNFNINALAEYDYKMGERSKLKLLLGTEYQQSITSGKDNIRYRGLDVLSTQYKDKGNFSETNLVANDVYVRPDQKWSFISYFLRANYAIGEKYYFQATGRVDGSSRFGANNRYGFFPVVSGAWLISEEDFLKDSEVLSTLKLKAAYGITGNASFENNQAIGTYLTNPNPVYNQRPIRYPNKVENPDLKWETTRNLDLGFELALLDDKINAEFSYYQKNTEDVIMKLILPNYNGFSDFYGNVGEIRNKGVELTLNTTNFQRGDFSWSTTFNIAYNTNKVLSIGGYTPDAVSGGTNDTRIVEGYPVGTNYLVRFSHVDAATGKPVYLDKNGYETFTYNEQDDRMPVGDVLPDAVGSFTNTFNYKSFDLSFLFVFVIGGDIYDSSSKRQLGFLSDWNTREDVGDHWRKAGDVAQYPKLTLTPAEHGNSKEWFNTDMWIHDASYMRLRNISLGYNLPATFLSKFRISKSRLSFSAMNLLTFTKFPGLDPEVVRDFDNQTDRNLSPNITYLTPPQEKSYNVSLNITF